MTNHLIFMSQKRFDSLDGLRAISIFAVIWHHTAPKWGSATLANIGANGVTLFFAISGFLITTLLLRERDRTGVIDIKAFYLRRILRIFPLYYGVLVLYIFLVATVERGSAAGQAFFGNLIYFATYTSNLFVPLDGRVILYFTWSLAAEEQFYLIWPIVLFITRPVSIAWVPLCLTIMACIVGQLLGSKFLSAVPLAIVAGALLAIALHTKKGFQVMQIILGQAWSFMVLLIILALVLTVVSVPNFVIHLLFTAVVGACVIRERHLLAPLLLLRPVAYIGSISYGMYMLHMLSKNVAVKMLGTLKLPGSGLEVFALTFIVATIFASISFKYYESYFLRQKSRHER